MKTPNGNVPESDIKPKVKFDGENGLAIGQ